MTLEPLKGEGNDLEVTPLAADEAVPDLLVNNLEGKRVNTGTAKSYARLRSFNQIPQQGRLSSKELNTWAVD